MTWSIFPYFAIPAIVLTIAGAVCALVGKRFSHTAQWLMLAATTILGAFIVGLWLTLQRPPLKTMGETRLWYAFFVTAAGLITYHRWHFRWLPTITAVLAIVFCTINLLRPELHDTTLMPALQSGWFVPHVVVYMLAYAVLGCAFALSVVGLYNGNARYLSSIDNLVYIGVALLSLGMLSGAIWAKQAWGDFWTWDPKETWAAATWCIYLIYIHQRLTCRTSPRKLYATVVVGFFLLQMCWYGYQYLPTAQSSMHVYGT